MKWTRDKPQVGGWYWVCSPPSKFNRTPRIIHFSRSTVPLDPENGPIQPTTDTSLSTEGWQFFAGPIPEPEDWKG